MSDLFNGDESDIALVLAALVQRSGGVVTIPEDAFQDLLTGRQIVNIDFDDEKRVVTVSLMDGSNSNVQRN